MEPFLVTNDLDRFEPSRLVVYATHNLSEAALAKNINNFVSVCEMVSQDDVVIATFVVIAKVCGLRIQITNVLLGVLCSTEVDLLVIDDLASFEYVQIGHAHSITWTDTLLGCGALTELVDIARRMFKVFPLRSKLLHFFVGQHVISIEVRIEITSFEHVR